ncbi:MAG: 50S ribosomal protein L7/L12 [Clostridia bacterium]
MMSEKITKLIEEIKALTVLELADMVKALETEFGVVAAAPVAAGAAAPAAAVEEVEEQTEFNVILKEIGAEKIKVIKVCREATGLGLKEAKDLVDNAPSTIKEAISKQAAEELVAKFKEVGATAEMK